MVEAGVAVTNRLAAAAAAAGSRVAGRERVDGKPGDADLPVEESAESAGALFPLRPVEGGVGLREHVALDLRSAWRRRTASCKRTWTMGSWGRQKVPRIVPTKSFRGVRPAQLEWSNLLIYLMFLW
jgi:hypothetical protein